MFKVEIDTLIDLVKKTKIILYNLVGGDDVLVIKNQKLNARLKNGIPSYIYIYYFKCPSIKYPEEKNHLKFLTH